MTSTQDLLETARPGGVRLVRCPNVARTLTELEILGEGEPDDRRFVACSWEEPPAVPGVIDAVVEAMADAALALWPAWYARDGKPNGLGMVDRLDADLLRGARQAVATVWLRAAAERCRSERRPLPDGFPLAVHASQLALAIEPRRLFLVFCVTGEAPRRERLYGLARAAEWFARETAATVFVLVPAALPEQGEWDNINFDQVWLDRREDAVVQPPPAGEDGTHRVQPAPGTAEGGRATGSFWIWPLQGVPHPNSEGEQLLAARLGRDAELAGLFEFNQPVRTVRDRRYTVDLLWAAGRLVVEVDGYRWHSDPAAFRHDRQRDYELIVSGYVVLRLPHDEVVADLESAVEKIRDVVAFRRRNRVGQAFQPAGQSEVEEL